MKKTILIIVLSTGLISCQMITNSSGIVLKNDEKSNLVKSHMEAYMENDSSVAEILFSKNLTTALVLTNALTLIIASPLVTPVTAWAQEESPTPNVPISEASGPTVVDLEVKNYAPATPSDAIWSAFSCRRSSTSNAINSKPWCTSSATP